MKNSFKVDVNKNWCKGCSICINVCPKKILKLGEDFKVYCVDESLCVGCAICEIKCPDYAITISKKEE